MKLLSKATWVVISFHVIPGSGSLAVDPFSKSNCNYGREFWCSMFLATVERHWQKHRIPNSLPHNPLWLLFGNGSVVWLYQPLFCDIIQHLVCHLERKRFDIWWPQKETLFCVCNIHQASSHPARKTNSLNRENFVINYVLRSDNNLVFWSISVSVCSLKCLGGWFFPEMFCLANFSFHETNLELM